MPGLLSCPGPVGLCGHAQNVQVAVADFDCEQDVEPAQRDRAVDVEEVDGHHAGGLAAQELPPTGVGVPERRRWDSVALEDPPDRRDVDSVAEFEQFALDFAVSPAWVLRRHPLHQRGDDVVDRWAAGSVLVGPLPGNGRNAKLQLTVLLAPEEPVDGLYLHPQHRRRARRADAPMGMDVQ
jgi:hypothetical protein